MRAKFTQHHDLAELLLSTGSARLVETGRVNNAVNRLWGEVDGKGQNMLGIMLMELRDELAHRPKAPTHVRRTSAKTSKPARLTQVAL